MANWRANVVVIKARECRRPCVSMCVSLHLYICLCVRVCGHPMIYRCGLMHTKLAAAAGPDPRFARILAGRRRWVCGCRAGSGCTSLVAVAVAVVVPI